ncbi:hypothetical protein KY348_07760 [Candidatus Woesearchaeota archaeon]|nr:hypothetical protein [Candidatus Woesearchaeota archaeon]
MKEYEVKDIPLEELVKTGGKRLEPLIKAIYNYGFLKIVCIEPGDYHSEHPQNYKDKVDAVITIPYTIEVEQMEDEIGNRVEQNNLKADIGFYQSHYKIIGEKDKKGNLLSIIIEPDKKLRSHDKMEQACDKGILLVADVLEKYLDKHRGLIREELKTA